ncbi:MAG: UbiA family prenyltransferase [Deltaproteobacteria bacterium]|nr:UbiA family prenyltransferase [Deltaproteobacteria bacterium]
MKQSLIVTVMHALRVYQWPKNLLLFVPLFAAHELTDQRKLSAGIVAFACFCLAASGLYLINDIRDRESDRKHERKKHRPIASGALSVNAALATAVGCLLLAFSCSLALPEKFQNYLLLYALSSLLYSTYLKRLLVLDVISLALFYTLRILAGGAATDIRVSEWLVSFSLFLFMSLACLKRFSELRVLKSRSEVQAAGRGYSVQDTEAISLFGGCSGYIAVAVLVLYISSEEVKALHRQPQFLWLVTPIALYWITRIWILAFRGIVDDDPVIFALRDKVTYVVAFAATGVLYLAI